MKKIILVMLVLALVGSMVFAQTVSVSNTTDAEIGELMYGEDAEIGVRQIRNATQVSVAGDMYTVDAKVRFKLGYNSDNDTDLDSVSVDDDTKVAMSVMPFAGFEIAAGTHLEDSVGVDSLWWDTDSASNGPGDKYYGLGTRYVNAGFMARYTGVENLMVAAVLPTDEDFGADWGENVDLIPLAFAASYNVADMVKVGAVVKLNIQNDELNQFTGVVDYMGLPMGNIGAYFTFTPEGENAALNPAKSQFGVVGSMNFAGLKVAPEFSMMIADVDYDTEGLPMFIKADLSYAINNITPFVRVWYSTGSVLKGADNYTAKFAVEPAVSYAIEGVGTASLGVNLRSQLDAAGDMDLEWYIPVSWTFSL